MNRKSSIGRHICGKERRPALFGEATERLCADYYSSILQNRVRNDVLFVRDPADGLDHGAAAMDGREAASELPSTTPVDGRERGERVAAVGRHPDCCTLCIL